MDGDVMTAERLLAETKARLASIADAARKQERQLAASQATVLAMRKMLECDGRVRGVGHEWRPGQWDDAREKLWCCHCGRLATDMVDGALATPPGSDAALRNICERCATDALSIWREDGVGEIAAVDQAVRRNLGAERAEGSET